MKMVVALGGNALGNSPAEQQQLVKITAKSLVDLIEMGHQLIITHGNGPQVGMINNAFIAGYEKQVTPEMPLPELVAMSQGYIGYHLQHAMIEELARRQINKPVVTLLTHVVVDEKDPSFENPTKPIGPFYTKEEALQLQKEKGYHMMEDAGRGYRVVVPSPKPLDIVEIDVIKSLVNAGVVVITVGGGGIPVIRKEHGFVGVPAVIDKDFASATIADRLNVDCLYILTAVDRVKIHYNQPNETSIERMTVDEAKKYIQDGHFASGSMLPKVESAINFVDGNNHRMSIIASLENTKAAFHGESGTKIIA